MGGDVLAGPGISSARNFPHSREVDDLFALLGRGGFPRPQLLAWPSENLDIGLKSCEKYYDLPKIPFQRTTGQHLLSGEDR
jgi:hypothetical protein